MGVTHQEMLDTPLSVIRRDIEIISMENTYLKPKPVKKKEDI